ncbi:TPA: hypothetical protein ACKQC7_004797 [Serratia marcescens]
MNKVNEVIILNALFAISFFFIPMSNALAYCYGGMIDSKIIERPVDNGDFFNEFNAESVLVVTSGRARYTEWSNREGTAPQDFHITIPEKIKFVSDKGFEFVLNASIRNGSGYVPGYSSVKVGYLPDGFCRNYNGGTYLNGRYNGDSVSIVLSGYGIPAGKYTGTLPYFFTYTDTSSPNALWQNFKNNIEPRGSTGRVPITIVANNNCTTSLQRISMDYGRVPANEIDGKVIQQGIGISCKNKTTMSYKIRGVAGSRDDYADCGNGQQCILSIESNGQSTSAGKVLIPSSGAIEMKVKSTFKVFKQISEGPFKGSGVLILTLE